MPLISSTASFPWSRHGSLVLSLPVWLRYLLAWRHELCLEVLGIFADALGSFYKDLSQDQGITDGRAGMVSAIQRFGGSLNLNIHFHVTALDGVFTQTSDGDLTFHEVDENDKR